MCVNVQSIDRKYQNSCNKVWYSTAYYMRSMLYGCRTSGLTRFRPTEALCQTRIGQDLWSIFRSHFPLREQNENRGRGHDSGQGQSYSIGHPMVPRPDINLSVVLYFVIWTHSSGLPKPRLDKCPPEIWNDEMIAIAAAASYIIWKPFQLISTQNSLKFASTKSYHSKLGIFSGLRAFQFQ